MAKDTDAEVMAAAETIKHVLRLVPADKRLAVVERALQAIARKPRRSPGARDATVRSGVTAGNAGLVDERLR